MLIKIQTTVKATRTTYKGQVAPIDMINGAVALVRDCKETSGMSELVILSLIKNAVGLNDYDLVKKNPTMRASKSEATASQDEAAGD